MSSSRGMDAAIAATTVTFDFGRQMLAEGEKSLCEVKCSELGDSIVKHF